MSFEELKAIYEKFQCVEILSVDEREITVKFSKKEKRTETLEELGYSFEAGI